MIARQLYAQGDILLERVGDIDPAARERDAVVPDPDGAVVVARGEVTGHRHAFHRGAALYRDEALAGDIPADLYVGHVRIEAETADLVHEEHATITLPKGTYRIRRQREFDPRTAPRVVQD